jgi:hypothetical protein
MMTNFAQKKDDKLPRSLFPAGAHQDPMLSARQHTSGDATQTPAVPPPPSRTNHLVVEKHRAPMKDAKKSLHPGDRVGAAISAKDQSVNRRRSVFRPKEP